MENEKMMSKNNLKIPRMQKVITGLLACVFSLASLSLAQAQSLPQPYNLTPENMARISDKLRNKVLDNMTLTRDLSQDIVSCRADVDGDRQLTGADVIA